MTIELFKCRKFGMKLEIFVQRHPHLILSRWTISIISFGSDIELRKFIVSVVLSFLMLALIFYAFFFTYEPLRFISFALPYMENQKWAKKTQKQQQQRQQHRRPTERYFLRCAYEYSTHLKFVVNAINGGIVYFAHAVIYRWFCKEPKHSILEKLKLVLNDLSLQFPHRIVAVSF